MALTTLANVKAWMALKIDTDDDQLTRLINAASAFIESWLNRTILTHACAERRNGNGKQTMLLADYPVTAISSLSICNVPVSPSAGYGLNGYQFDDTTLYLCGPLFTRGLQNVLISYTAGYETVPPDIEQACIELVALRYKERSRIGEQSKALGGGETVSYFTGDMTPSAKSILQQYKRVVQP